MIENLTPLECANTLYKATTKLQATADDHQILAECYRKVIAVLDLRHDEDGNPAGDDEG